ncbi:ninein-like protein isoform X2 [Clinocottus analis]|uniref:ninein-like protein isoform X2 n=1 Tax=Clinocottus analis TaxID=304258 RepID=UPI0035C1F158
MEGAGLSHYSSQLKAEFDSCDSKACGFLDADELTELCRKLQLQDPLLLLDTLLGARAGCRVNFEEFKEGFVAVLSRSLDFSTSEDDSSYLEPVVAEEVKPKFLKGTKRYGRRSRPDAAGPVDCPSGTEAADSSPSAKLRRSTSLESVQSLKSDEEAGSLKENILPALQSKGGAGRGEGRGAGGGGRGAGGGERGAGGGGAGGGVLKTACDRLDHQQLAPEDLDAIGDFQEVSCGSAPICCSTPIRSADLQRAPPRDRRPLQPRASEERSARSASSSLLAAPEGQRVLSRLDEGSGCTGPERVLALWTEEGIRNSRDILQTLDFPLEERLSLADLTLALDNELLVSGNGIHQAALISYKNEIQHLQVLGEQACRQRDKLKLDLDQAQQRTLQLVREVDDRHASMETLNQSRIRELEQLSRDRLAAVRSRAEQEAELQLQQAERERCSLQAELRRLRGREAELQEELSSAAQESRRLEEELSDVKLKLTGAQRCVRRLQRDLLLHKLSGSDPAEGLSHEEQIQEIIRDHELQSRELRDRNDELSSELELLRSDRKSRRSAGGSPEPDEGDMKRSSSPQVRRKLQPADKTALGSLQVSGPSVSIQTELALEQLKQNHQQELQQLHIQLDTQVNYYERSLEVMRQSMEVERKDISQAFKMEISELEEHKAQVEQQVKQLKEQLQRGGGAGGWSNQEERRMQRERAELEQNFAREIGNLVQRLSSEKDQLEAELRLQADQEVALVRTQLAEVQSENVVLQERLGALQQEVTQLEDHAHKKRRKVEEMEREHERSRAEEERLHKENSRYREEVLALSGRNLQLSDDNAELSARLQEDRDQDSVRMLRERLAAAREEQEEQEATVRRLQDAALQQEVVWTQEKQLLDRQLSCYEEEVEALQRSLLSLESEAELLRTRLHDREEGHAHQEVGHAHQEVTEKVEELEREVEELRQASVTLQEETHELRVQNQELLHQLAALQVRSLEVQEQQNLEAKLSELQTERTQDRDQHLNQLQELQEEQLQARLEEERLQARLQEERLQARLQEERLQARLQEERLQARLQEEQGRSQQLEEQLRLQAQQSSSHISMKQGQSEKAVSSLQQRVEGLETTLKAVRLVLQEKVQQLKDQLKKNTKCSALLKELHQENSQLMKALQVTEQRQKQAEKKNFLLEDRVRALNHLLREIVPAALAS